MVPRNRTGWRCTIQQAVDAYRSRTTAQRVRIFSSNRLLLIYIACSARRVKQCVGLVAMPTMKVSRSNEPSIRTNTPYSPACNKPRSILGSIPDLQRPPPCPHPHVVSAKRCTFSAQKREGFLLLKKYTGIPLVLQTQLRAA